MKANIFSSQMSGVEDIIQDSKEQKEIGMPVLKQYQESPVRKLKQILIDMDSCNWASEKANNPSIWAFCQGLSTEDDVSGKLRATPDVSVMEAAKGFGEGISVEGNQKIVQQHVEYELAGMKLVFRAWWAVWVRLYKSQDGMCFFENRLDCVTMAEKMLTELHAFRNNWVYFAGLFGGEQFSNGTDFRDSEGHLIGGDLDHGIHDGINKSNDDVIDHEKSARVRAVLNKDNELEDRLEEVQNRIKAIEDKIKDEEPILIGKEEELDKVTSEIQELMDKKADLEKNISKYASDVKNDQARLDELRSEQQTWAYEMEKIMEEEKDAAEDTVKHLVKREVENLVHGKGTAFSKKEGEKVKGAVGVDGGGGHGSVHPEHSASLSSIHGSDSASNRGDIGYAHDDIVDDRFGKVSDGHWEYRDGRVSGDRTRVIDSHDVNSLAGAVNRLNLDDSHLQDKAAVDWVTMMGGKRVLTEEGWKNLGIKHIDSMLQGDTTDRSVKTSIILKPESISSKPKQTQQAYRTHDVYYMLYSMLKHKLILVGLSNVWYDHLKQIFEKLKMTGSVPANKPANVNESIWKMYSQYFSPEYGGKKHPIVEYIENFRANNSPELIQCINMALENVIVGLLLHTLEKNGEIMKDEKEKITDWHEEAMSKRKALSEKIGMPGTPRTLPVYSSPSRPPERSSSKQVRRSFQIPYPHSQYHLSSPFYHPLPSCCCLRCGLRIFSTLQ